MVFIYWRWCICDSGCGKSLGNVGNAKLRNAADLFVFVIYWCEIQNLVITTSCHKQPKDVSRVSVSLRACALMKLLFVPSGAEIGTKTRLCGMGGDSTMDAFTSVCVHVMWHGSDRSLTLSGTCPERGRFLWWRHQTRFCFKPSFVKDTRFWKKPSVSCCTVGQTTLMREVCSIVAGICDSDVCFGCMCNHEFAHPWLSVFLFLYLFPKRSGRKKYYCGNGWSHVESPASSGSSMIVWWTVFWFSHTESEQWLNWGLWSSSGAVCVPTPQLRCIVVSK